MTSKTVILVTGATGQAGSEICSQLSRMPDIEVRAGIHTPSKKDLLPAGVHPVPFDTAEPQTVATACEGVDRLFLLTPGGPLGPASTRVILDAATAAKGIERIVKLSSIDPEVEPQAPTDLWALETENMVRETGLPHTFLRPTWFFQNFSNGYFVPMLMRRMLTLPFGDGSAGWIDSRDVAAVAVETLLGDGHAGKTYTLTGPALVTLQDIAEAFSRVTNQQIPYHALSDQQWFEAIRQAGGSDQEAAATLALIAKTRDGHCRRLTDEVERLIGRSPRTLAVFASDHADLLTSLATAS